MKLILGFVGEIASGKGAACDYLIKKHQAGYHRFSTILRDILDRLHLEQSRENMQKLSTSLRQIFSEDIFAKVIAEDVNQDPADIICVDGIRRPADIVYLKKLPSFYLIHVVANEKIRFERLAKRSENSDDRNKTFAEFQKESQNESEQNIRLIAAEARHTIENNGSSENLCANLETLLEKLKK